MFSAATPTHQYAAVTKRAWGDERWAGLPYVPITPPHAALRAPPGAHASGSAPTERTAVPAHDAASATETGQYQHRDASPLVMMSFWGFICVTQLLLFVLCWIE